MRSVTSSCNFAIYRKDLGRYWPLWAVNFVFWFLIMPLQGLLYLSGSGSLETFANDSIPDVSGGWVCVMAAVVGGVLTAMAVCSHLYNPRSANFMASLPTKRPGQFLSHYFAGLTIMWAPLVLVFFLTLLVELAGGTLVASHLVWWLIITGGAYFFFYSFAVCIGMFTGNLVTLPVFYGIFNALAAGVMSLSNWLIAGFYYGFYGFPEDVTDRVMWLTPTTKLMEAHWVSKAAEGRVLLIYAIAAVVLTVCALLLYCHRHLETAGDVVSVRAMRPVFKYAVAVLGGVMMGQITAVILSLGELGLSISVVIWAVVFYFVAQMLLDKSFRVLKKWKGAAAVAVIFAALFCVMALDLTGYESRVPQVDEVESVSVVGLNLSPYDSGSSLDVEITEPELIEMVTNIHKAHLDEREESEAADYYWNSYSLDLIYRLKNGTEMTRKYTILIPDTDVGKEGTLADLIEKFHNEPAVMWKSYEIAGIKDFIENGIAWAYVEANNVRIKEGEDTRRLWDSVCADLREGRIGQHSMRGDDADYIITSEWVASDGPQRRWMEIHVSKGDSRTARLLEELGIPTLDESNKD